MNLLCTHLSSSVQDKIADQYSSASSPVISCKGSGSSSGDSNESDSRGLEVVANANESDTTSQIKVTSKKRIRADDTGYKEVFGQRGISTVNRVLSSSDQHLVSLLDGSLSTTEVRWLKNDLARKTKPRGIRLSELLDNYRIYCKCLSTGSGSLDDLLNGGMMTGELTEIAGPSASGKTQLCLSVLATLLIDSDSARAVYIDSGKSSFNAGRLKEILSKRLEQSKAGNASDKEQYVAERLGQCLGRVRCMRAYDISSLASVLTQQIGRYEDERQVKHGPGTLRLVIVDAISSIFAPVVGGGGKGAGALCFSAMGHIAHLLRRLAEQLNVAIVLTNSVVLDRVQGTKPALGRTWSKEPNVRLQLSVRDSFAAVTSNGVSSDDRYFQAIITKSCRSPLTAPPVVYSLGSCGILDVKPNQTAAPASRP